MPLKHCFQPCCCLQVTETYNAVGFLLDVFFLERPNVLEALCNAERFIAKNQWENVEQDMSVYFGMK